MEEKNITKISLSTFFLILAIIAIIVMGIFIYKLNNDKTAETQKSAELQAQVNSLNGTVGELQGKINTISDTVSSKDNENTNTEDNTINSKTENQTTTSLVNKRLYKLYSNQRYILLMDDNAYDTDQDFLKKKTYILDLNMINGNELVKEVNLSNKLTPFVNEYINKNKGSKNGTCTVEYFGVEDMMTPPDINEENEVAFKVYYRCVDENTETSMGSEIYAYNVKTDTIRDLGSAN